MTDLSSWEVFLSYRREDSAPYARLLQRDFSEHLPDARVFLDVDSIEAGLDFDEVIRQAVGSCAVLVALIGSQWLTLTDEEGGRRLDDPGDYVRLELQSALERDIRVIPVLVGGAEPLRQQQLPSELQQLARLNALELSHDRYKYDVDRLLRALRRVLDAESSAATAHKPSPTDPDRAQRVAQSITGGLMEKILNFPEKSAALASVAEALAATDPDRAERIAQSISDELPKALALVRIAGKLESAGSTETD